MRKLCIALVVASLLICGCGKPEDKFIGKWEGELVVPQSLLDKAKLAALDDKKPMFDDLSMTLDLNDDGTYRLALISFDDSGTGTWTLSEDSKSISLSPPVPKGDKMDSMFAAAAKEKSMTLTVSEDGSTLEYEETLNGQNGGMKFSR